MSIQGVPVPGVVPHRADGLFNNHIAFALWKLLRDQAAAINRLGAGEVTIPEPFPAGNFDATLANTVSTILRQHAEAINRLGGEIEVPGVIVARGTTFGEVLATEIGLTLWKHAREINVLAA